MFQIDLKSRKSIYQQVIDNFKELIIKGVLKTDEKLPSVRELSKMLTVNPNTISKAYKELEREGYIYSMSGLGTFVAEPPVENNARLNEIREHLAFHINELSFAGLDEEAIAKFVNDILNERGKSND